MARKPPGLKVAMKRIRKEYKPRGKRYDRLVEDLFKSGYRPIPKLSEGDRAKMRRIIRRHPNAVKQVRKALSAKAVWVRVVGRSE